MAIKIKTGTYACSICGTEYTREGKPYEGGNAQIDAEKCEIEHNAVYFPITRGELSALIQFIYTKEDDLIPDQLYRRLKKYNNKSFSG
jgi:hypothetical protein